MKYIVLDLEMNGVPKDNKEAFESSHMEIIEIGAVALDEDYREIDSFLTYVKPRFNEIIEPRYEEMTGISTAMVKDAPGFEVAFEQFFRWCIDLDKEYEIITWSSNDEMQIRHDMKQNKYQMSNEVKQFMNGWKDFQKIMGEMLGLERVLSLEKAIELMGLDFQGRQHDALNDARNTAEIYAVVFDDKRDKEALNRVKEALHPKTEGASLGELFDFSQFVQS